MARSNPYLLYRAAARAASALPDRVALPVGRALGTAAWAVLPSRRALVARHQDRVRHGSARAVPSRGARRSARDAFASYGRYWMESLRLPHVTPEQVDAHFSIEGREHLEAARADGRGAVLALPHLGGWDVGGSWLARQGFSVSVVVEALEPPELFDWFVGLRQAFGLQVIPLGSEAGTGVLAALRANHMVCLLCDRDIGGGGVEVEFFGERTRLPGGPATLAFRSGCALVPAAVYHTASGGHAVIHPPLPCERRGRLSDDVARVTQALAHELEELIRRAPEQWHLFQPNWPSDREA